MASLTLQETSLTNWLFLNAIWIYQNTVHIPLTAKGLKKTRSSQLEDDSELRPIFSIRLCQ